MSRRALPWALAVAAALALSAPALAGGTTVGLRPGADPGVVSAAIERATGARATSLAPLRALSVDASVADVRDVAGVAWAEPDRVRRVSFVPTDPLAPKQWYAAANRAYDAWETPPPLAPVRVAVIDSGIDLTHPDLSRQVAVAKSFVGGSAQDTRGHGTIVAGIIAAQLDNDVGIAGLAPAAELVVAKVVSPNGTISVQSESRAIHWAVDNGARVVNVSLGGLRDPRNPGRDTYSRLEQEAIAYAVKRGAVVVAAVGNSDQAPRTPWRFASYPAALPHVLGVSALTRGGASPAFSNRDAVYNDVAAPGEDILSTFPRSLTGERASCADQGYTPCATDEFRPPEGTSFAAPQASAVAANLLGARPLLRPEQVTAIIERSAVDASAQTGCRACAPGRDAYTGWGALDATAAMTALGGQLPPRDAHEPNDDAGEDAYRLYFPAGEKARFVKASLDFWDDQDDVYAVYLHRRREALRLARAVAGREGGARALAAGDASPWPISRGRTCAFASRTGRVAASGSAGGPTRRAGTSSRRGSLRRPSSPVAYRLSIVRTR